MMGDTYGSLIPSGGVVYTGKDLSFLTSETQISCDANLNDVISKISDEIKVIKTNTDVSAVNKGCLTISGPITFTKLAQAQVDKLCALSAQFEVLSETIDDLQIGSQPIQIDLGCLTPSAAPCQIATNIYTLISILNTFKNEICAIKTELGI